MSKLDKKVISFLIGAVLAGLSLTYFKIQPIVAFIGILVGAYLIIKAFD